MPRLPVTESVVRSIRFLATPEELYAAQMKLMAELERNRGHADLMAPWNTPEMQRRFKAAHARRFDACERLLRLLMMDDPGPPPETYQPHVIRMALLDLLGDLPETISVKFLRYACLPAALAASEGTNPTEYHDEVNALREALRNGRELTARIGEGGEDDPADPRRAPEAG